jgi:hypothetical protein
VPKPALPSRTAASASEGSGSSRLLAAIAVGCCIFTNASIKFVFTPASRADTPKRGSYVGGAASHERPSALVCRTRAIPVPLASESATLPIWWNKDQFYGKCKRQKVDLALRSWRRTMCDRSDANHARNVRAGTRRNSLRPTSASECSAAKGDDARRVRLRSPHRPGLCGVG